MSPKLSVILPAYNAAERLPRALESLRAQTFTDWETLIVDDGSVDDTSATVENFMREDARFRLIRRPHEGIVSALNAGLNEARGSLIARQDADDWSAPERFEAQVALLTDRPGLGLVSCLVRHAADGETWADGARETRGYSAYCDWLNAIQEPAEIRRASFIESPLAHPSVLFRRELLELHGAYRDGDFPEDYELWLRWLDAGVAMAKVPRELYAWLDSPTRLSRTDPRYSSRAFNRLQSASLAAWLKANNRFAPQVVIWGAGQVARRRAAGLVDLGCEIAAFLDVDVNKRGRTIAGRPVFLADEFEGFGRCFILSYVGNRGAGSQIRDFLLAKGLREEIDFLICA